MNRIDVMVDIESLGKNNCPPVFQISAVAFNIETGEIYSTFNEIADITKMTNIEGDTLKWWLNTNPNLLTDLINKGISTEKEIISKFLLWLLRLQSLSSTEKTALKDIYLWGNGILFDNRILKAKCDEHNLCYPIFYRNDRDMRTIVELAAIKKNQTSKEFIESFPFTGTMHNAIDDAINQAKIVCEAYNILMED